MCGNVTNVKLRCIKYAAGFEIGETYEPYWYRTHDMNRSPLGYTVLYFKVDGKELTAHLDIFEEANKQELDILEKRIHYALTWFSDKPEADPFQGNS